ncbi:hypothetical protein BU16DRAFT_558771 [Lophium mytilinum]|uniref:Uncharacterized protein n=1 Tax=Lophium mytilinum TaxID=390894 RepID=A0A6A6R2Z1_9PEZI|nr:hypothetical protein BU16DRAFT_558771 [Lophium mytilinum]
MEESVSTDADSSTELSGFLADIFLVTGWALIKVLTLFFLVLLNGPTYIYIRCLHERLKSTADWDDASAKASIVGCLCVVGFFQSMAYIVTLSIQWHEPESTSMLLFLELASKLVLSFNVAGAIVFGLLWGLVLLVERAQTSPTNDDLVAQPQLNRYFQRL